MSKPKWATEPWLLKRYLRSNAVTITTDPDNPKADVCNVLGCTPEKAEAHVNLLNAARELYAALESLLQITEAVDGLTKAEWRPEIEAARAALAKARGDKPDFGFGGKNEQRL